MRSDKEDFSINFTMEAKPHQSKAIASADKPESETPALNRQGAAVAAWMLRNVYLSQDKNKSGE